MRIVAAVHTLAWVRSLRARGREEGEKRGGGEREKMDKPKGQTQARREKKRGRITHTRVLPAARNTSRRTTRHPQQGRRQQRTAERPPKKTKRRREREPRHMDNSVSPQRQGRAPPTSVSSAAPRQRRLRYQQHQAHDPTEGRVDHTAQPTRRAREKEKKPRAQKNSVSCALPLSSRRRGSLRFPLIQPQHIAWTTRNQRADCARERGASQKQRQP